VSTPLELDPAAEAELDRLGKARRWDLLGSIEDKLDALAADPGSKENRKRAFPGGMFGITVWDPGDAWLIIWEYDGDVIAVRYIGSDPFA
jgi:hypothetical protein